MDPSRNLLPIKLEDDAVLLRPLEESDIELLLPFSVNEPELWKWALTQGGGGRQNLSAYIAGALERKAAATEFPFLVIDKSSGLPAGTTRYYDIQAKHRSLHIGYTWYGREFQGTGLNSHCKLLLLGHAFGPMGMERVEFRADRRNARSIAALKSIGGTVEGVLRSCAQALDGTRRDSIVISILRSEWDDRVHDLLERLCLEKE